MTDKFYTIDQVAETIGVHHKTVRKFIAEGKLKAAKIGKQWRITAYDLDSFMGNNYRKDENESHAEMELVDFSTINNEDKSIRNQISVSTVIDIKDLKPDEYRRISNMLLAVMNSNDIKMKESTINIKYYPKEDSVKIMLWGSVEFVKEMLDLVTILVEENPN